MIKRVVKVLWIFIALIALACIIIFFSIAKGWIGYMPPVEDLENPNYKFATEIFSEDGKVLGTYSYSKENRVFVECRRRQYHQPAAFQAALFSERR